MSSLTHQYTQKLKNSLLDIDKYAIQILRRLKESGFQAYLVGGGVRDLLVNLTPKDFDIATNALPNEVRKKVPYSFIIGRRFKLVHARRGEQIFEIATFRRAASAAEIESTDLEERFFVEDNFYGNIEEDSFRRDFTINSLFYDPIDEKIIDHCEGLKDIASCTLRMIGKPHDRLMEDPIRILRAIRLSQKLIFTIEPELRGKILELKDELKRTAPQRRREEWLKFFRLNKVDQSLIELYDLGVFESVVPSLHQLFSNEDKRLDLFSYIRRFKEVGINLNDPIELISAILHAFIQIEYPNHPDLYELSESENFVQFCRDEFGIFKAEQASYFQAAQFIQILKDKEPYLKRGDRRKKAILNHQSFLLSLKLGLLSFELNPSDILFWLNELESIDSKSFIENDFESDSDDEILSNNIEKNKT